VEICYITDVTLCYTDSIVMVLHYREVGDICYIFHHGATIYAFYFVMVSANFLWFLVLSSREVSSENQCKVANDPFG